MDETTKVIIATLSGFIIAFFAEPVKNYFENRAKLNNLRIALYKELLNNYKNVAMVIRGKDIAFKSRVKVLRNALRTECYKHALENEVSLFYRLEEANDINMLEGAMLSTIAGYLNEMESVSEARFVDVSRQFTVSYEALFYTKMLDAKILKGIMSKTQYQEIASKGKEVCKKLDAENDAKHKGQ